MTLTWDEVRARSEQTIRPGLTVFCAACRMNFDLVEMPCLEHCISEDERMERHRRFQPKVEAEIRQLMEIFK